MSSRCTVLLIWPLTRAQAAIIRMGESWRTGQIQNLVIELMRSSELRSGSLIGLQLSDERSAEDWVSVATWDLGAKMLTRCWPGHKMSIYNIFNNEDLYPLQIVQCLGLQCDTMKNIQRRDWRHKGLFLFVSWLFPAKKILSPVGSKCRCSIRSSLWRSFYSNSVNGGNFVAIIHRNKRDSHTNQDQPLSVPSACCSRQSQNVGFFGAFLGTAFNSDDSKIYAVCS